MNINYEKVEIKLGDVVEYKDDYYIIIFDNESTTFKLLDLNSYQIIDWVDGDTLDMLVNALNLKYVDSQLTIKR